MKTQPLTADQLTAAALNWTATYSGASEDPTALDIAAFIAPLVGKPPVAECIHKLLDAARDVHECEKEAQTMWAAMEENTGAWERHAMKARNKVRRIAEAIVDGGRPE